MGGHPGEWSQGLAMRQIGTLLLRSSNLSK
jgi:hypothetical protein